MMNWYSPKPILGELPPSLAKHTLTLVGSKFYLLFAHFGGATKRDAERKNPEADEYVYVFDADVLFWSKKRTHGTAPPARLAHSATAVGDRIFVFAGGLGSTFYNDVFVFDTKTLSWQKPTVTGVPPPARRAHTTTLLSHRLVVFGGGEASGRALNDVWLLDTEKQTWTSLSAANPPAPRGYHSAVALSTSRLLVYGGTDTRECYSDVCVLDVDRRQWTRPRVVFSVPRFGHAAALIGPWMFVFGGHDASDAVDSMHILNLDTLEWMKKPTAGQPPSKRAYHSLTAFDSRLWVFGGNSTTGGLLDLMLLDLSSFAFLSTCRRQPKMF